MLQFHLSIGKAKDEIKHSVKTAIASAWIERLARIGYAAKGVVYMIVGWLATLAALRRGDRFSWGSPRDSASAIRSISAFRSRGWPFRIRDMAFCAGYY